MIQGNATKHGRYDTAQLATLAEEFQRDGICILRDHIPAEVIANWRHAFEPLLEGQIAIEGAETSRGPNRYYVTLPFNAPFADPAVFEDEDILALCKKLVGDDMVFCQLATDTPVLGSTHQAIHRDCPPLFPEWGVETPSFQLAVNFSLVDINAQNGPFEIVRGTHRLSREEGLRRLETGEAKMETVFMKAGDVMIRDVRALHRGTPNFTREPRPMVVLGYSRSWMHRPEVSIHVPRAALATLSDRARKMMRFNPIVDEARCENKVESYQVFAY